MAPTVKTHLSVLAQKIPLTCSQKFSLLLWQVQIADDIIQVPLSQQVSYNGRTGSCKYWITIHIVVSLAYSSSLDSLSLSERCGWWRSSGNIHEFSVQKYIRNRHFSSWEKIFVDQCDHKLVRIHSRRIWMLSKYLCS
jgi:hypothetical protein